MLHDIKKRGFTVRRLFTFFETALGLFLFRSLFLLAVFSFSTNRSGTAT